MCSGGRTIESLDFIDLHSNGNQVDVLFGISSNGLLQRTFRWFCRLSLVAYCELEKTCQFNLVFGQTINIANCIATADMRQNVTGSSPY